MGWRIDKLAGAVLGDSIVVARVQDGAPTRPTSRERDGRACPRGQVGCDPGGASTKRQKAAEPSGAKVGSVQLYTMSGEEEGANVIAAGRTATRDFVPPPEFDDYVLLQELGRGQMGRVYLA